jgi:uncharacterized protein YbjT (DUF2867 family)
LKIVLAGATGLVGKALLKILEEDPSIDAIDVIGRRLSESQSGKVIQHVAPITEWPLLITQIKSDIAISTLGTTLKQAGSEAAFAAIDLDSVLAFARASLAAGARRLMVVTSIGAHPSSRNFYLATKGKLEQEIQTIGFDRVDVFRPGLLRGERAGPLRLGEKIAMSISPLTDLLTPKAFDHFRSIMAADVAKAIVRTTGATECGTFFHDNRAIMHLASNQ